jgi:flagellar motility protein MotE (MotC chaperone)
MKNKLIYFSVFLIVFLITTGTIVYLNSIYVDIFQLDFRPIPVAANNNILTDTSKVSYADLKELLIGDFKREILDSLKNLEPNQKKDTLQAIGYKDSTLIDTIKSLQATLKSMDSLLSGNNLTQPTQSKVTDTKIKPDSAYIAWTKKTAKLYESMDPKRAAKIIQSYSDNVARDIIYSMKQKKAADILSELNPDTANRITRAKSNAF